MKINKVTVRLFGRYLEEFEATEVRFGSDLSALNKLPFLGYFISNALLSKRK